MAQTVFLVASTTTAFRRAPERTHASFAEEVIAALPLSGLKIDRIVFGSAAMQMFGQTNLRGQVALSAATRRGAIAAGLPVVNVEGACATGALVLQTAVEAIASGGAEIALALGVDKTFHPEPAKIFELFAHGIDQMEPKRWHEFYEQRQEQAGQPFAPHPQRIVFLDIAAMSAARHMKRYGTTERQLAVIASKNHAHGALNDKAQHRERMSVEQVLADKISLPPFRRSMCAPISDGGAGAILCSERAFKSLPAAMRARAVRITSIASAGGRERELDDESVDARVIAAALRAANTKIGDVDLFEVHDSTAFAELAIYEAAGLCGAGEGGRFAETGSTALGGDRPVNLSGGLEAKGHPIAATGLAMVAELHTQLLGDAGPRQTSRARRALFHNAGGQIGFDQAIAVAGLLER